MFSGELKPLKGMRLPKNRKKGEKQMEKLIRQNPKITDVY